MANMPSLQQNTVDPLAQLRPIIMPTETISWWPLAPGWWMLLALLCILIASGFLIRNYFVKKKWRKELQDNTLSLLESTFSACSKIKDGNEALQIYLQQSNLVFKRLVNQFLHDEKTNTLSGQQWADFINQQDSAIDTSYANYYGKQLYAKRADTTVALADLHQWACQWSTSFFKRHKKMAFGK